MLGRHGERFAEAQRIGLHRAAFARLALSLVGDHHHRHFLLAQVAGDFLVERGQPGARIDHEDRRVRACEAGLGLLAHPARQAEFVLVLPPGGIDHGEMQTRDIGIAHPPVARHSRLIIDQRELLAHQPVEQRGLADIGSADNDNFGLAGHGHNARQVGANAGFGKE